MVKMYFRLRAENVDVRLISRSRSTIFGSEIAGMFTSDLQSPEASFRSLRLPRCGD